MMHNIATKTVGRLQLVLPPLETRQLLSTNQIDHGMGNVAISNSFPLKIKPDFPLGHITLERSMADRNMLALSSALLLTVLNYAGGEIVKGSVSLNSGVFDKVNAKCFH